jgi:hypothetical protein
MAKDDGQQAPQALVGMSQEQFAALLSMFQQRTDSPELGEAIKAITAMAEAQVAATKTLGDEVKRTVMRSNADHEHISVFNFKRGCQYCDTGTRHPEDPNVMGSGKIGHPKPNLKYETFWPKNAKVHTDDATVLEVELFNELGDRLQTAGRITARYDQLTAEVTNRGRRLVVDAPVYTADERGDYGPLPQVLLELLHGKASLNPSAAIEEVIALRERIAALEAKQLASV